MTGPIFYAIKVATRSDNSTVYLSRTMERGGTYKRATLGEAARYMDRTSAEIHLDESREIGPEIVALRGVTGLNGNWRAWHLTDDGNGRVLNGPEGETVTMAAPGSDKRTDRFPWIARWPEGHLLEDQHGRTRSFASALAARKAIERAMLDEHRRHIPEFRNPG